MKMSPFSAPFSGAPKSEGFCFQSERLLYGREPNVSSAEPESGSREAAGRRNWPEAVPRRMSGRKRLACGTRKIGVVPAETSGQVKRKRKSQLCDDHHRFENGARFEGLLPFAAVTSEWRQYTRNVPATNHSSARRVVFRPTRE